MKGVKKKDREYWWKEATKDLSEEDLAKLKQIPTLLALPDKKKKRALVWCEYCDNWHFHSYGSGHRVAHCTRGLGNDSPYVESGYILKMIPRSWLKEFGY